MTDPEENCILCDYPLTEEEIALNNGICDDCI